MRKLGLLLCFLLVCLVGVSCNKKPIEESFQVPGKIVFESNRDDKKWGIYLYDKGEIKFLKPVLRTIGMTFFPSGDILYNTNSKNKG